MVGGCFGFTGSFPRDFLISFTSVTRFFESIVAAAVAADAFWSAMPGAPPGRAKASAARGTATPGCGLGGRSPFSPHTLNGRQVAAALAKAASEKTAAEAAAAAKERELIELRVQLAAAKKQAKSKPAPPPFGRGRGMPCDCGCDGSETAHATNAFMTNGRSEDAAARKARRVGEKLENALPDDPEQAGAALQQAIAKRPRVRAAAEAVGVRTAGQIASAERIMARVQEAVKLFKMKSGGISDDVSTALNSFFTLGAPEKNEDALVRGRQAKRARPQSLQPSAARRARR